MPKDTLSRIGDSIFKEELGFIPTSNSTKPPHIANGLFRMCCDEYSDIHDINSWVVSEDKKNAISTEVLAEDYQDIFSNGKNENINNIKNLRFLLSELFNQDNTTYASDEFSVFTISSHWLINSSVSPEARIGDFLYNVLKKKINGKQSPIIELLKSTLAKDNDDLTKLLKPIITYPSDQAKRKTGVNSLITDNKIEWNDAKQIIRDGFDKLAANIVLRKEENNSLLVLERIVNFSLFATFFYLISCNYYLHNGKLPPLLIDSGVELESIKKASEQTYIMAKKSIEDYVVNVSEKIIKAELTADTEKACLDWINDMVIDKDTDDSKRKAIISYFNNFLLEEKSPKRALARSLQIALYTLLYSNNTPSDFCRVLGVRGGLIGPRGNRATRKRYLINAFTLENITLSVLTEDDFKYGIELKDLSRRLSDVYNILLGADSDYEYKILEENNIVQSTPGDLRGDLSLNAQNLAAIYISIGLGKQYADGVTLIGGEL